MTDLFKDFRFSMNLDEPSLLGVRKIGEINWSLTSLHLTIAPDWHRSEIVAISLLISSVEKLGFLG